MPMARGNGVQRLAGGNHQHIHRIQAQTLGPLFRGQQPAHLIEAFEQFDIAFQAVDKGAVEHMPTDLRQGRRPHLLWTLLARRAGFTVGIAANPHHQHPIGTQMQGRADRCRLTHGAITEVFAIDLHRREYQRNRGAGQQMLQPQTGRHPHTAMAEPGVDGGAALVEGHRLAGFVAEGRDRHRPQLPVAHCRGNTGKVQFAGQQLGQG